MTKEEDRVALQLLHRHVLGHEPVTPDTDADMLQAMRKFHRAWKRSTALQRQKPALIKFSALLQTGSHLPAVSALLQLPPCIEVHNLEAGTVEHVRTPKRKTPDESNTLLRCTVCWDAERQEVWGCGHMVACLACSAKLTECPLCRAKICKRQRVYLS